MLTLSLFNCSINLLTLSNFSFFSYFLYKCNSNYFTNKHPLKIKYIDF